MNLPSTSKLSIKKPCQYFDRSCKTADRLKHFGKAPRDVNSIPSKWLSPIAKLVFYAFGDESKGTTKAIWLSDSDLADRSGVSRPSVIEAREQLEGLGLLARHGKPIKQVQGYQIMHWMFRTPGSFACAEITDGPKRRGMIRAGELTPTIIQCPRCARHCGGLLKVGWCRRCNSDDRMRKIADEQIVKAKTA